MAEACARAGAAMVYISSNEVFDGAKREPYTEEDEPRPINAYARSKLAGERYVQSTMERYYIVRTAWLYGAGRVSFPEKVLQAATEARSLKGVTDEIASPTWTADLAAGIAALVQGTPFGIYHLTSSGWRPSLTSPRPQTSPRTRPLSSWRASRSSLSWWPAPSRH